MIEKILSIILGVALTFVIPISILLFAILFIYEVFIRFRK